MKFIKNISIIVFSYGLINGIGAYIIKDTLVNNNTDTMIVCSVYNKKNNLRKVYTILNNQFHGVFKEYYDSGKLKNISKYDNGAIIDTIFDYYENGNLKSIAVLDGISIMLSEKGDTLGLANMCNGNPCKIAEAYYKNRNRKYIHKYNDSGQKHGLCESWREDGNRKDSIVYHNGDIIELRAYFLNGKVRHWIKKVDKDSYKTLEAFYYDTSGAVCGEVKNGNGNFISWSDNYENRWLKSYKNGEEVASRELEPYENPDWK